MITHWVQGRDVVEQLISDDRVEHVSASRELADLALGQARLHLSTAAQICDTDPAAGFQTAYDAARKALTAILENQGLRARNVRGAHAVLLEVALAQLDPPMGKSLRHFDWMRRTRHSTEYPTLEAPQVTAEDVRDAVAFAQDIVDIAGRVIPEMPVF